MTLRNCDIINERAKPFVEQPMAETIPGAKAAPGGGFVLHLAGWPVAVKDQGPSWAPTHSSPSAQTSFFQMGTIFFRRSMAYRQASKASAR